MTTILQKVAEIFNPRATSDQEDSVEDNEMGRPEGTGLLDESVPIRSGTPTENVGVNQDQQGQREDQEGSGMNAPSGRARRSRRGVLTDEESPYVTSFFVKAKRKKSPEGIGRRTRSRTTPPPEANQGAEEGNVIDSSQGSNWSLMSSTPESSMELIDPSTITNVPLHLSNFKLSMTLKTDDVDDPGTTLTIGTKPRGRGSGQDILGSARISRGSRISTRGGERIVPEERAETPELSQGRSTRATRSRKSATPEEIQTQDISQMEEDSQRMPDVTDEGADQGDFIDTHESMDVIDEDRGEELGAQDVESPSETGGEEPRQLRSKGGKVSPGIPEARKGEKHPTRSSPRTTTPTSDKDQEIEPRATQTSSSEEVSQGPPTQRTTRTSESKESTHEPRERPKKSSSSKEVPEMPSSETSKEQSEESGPSTRTRQRSLSKEPSAEPTPSTLSGKRAASNEPSREPSPSKRAAKSPASEEPRPSTRTRRGSASKAPSEEPAAPSTPSTIGSKSPEKRQHRPASTSSTIPEEPEQAEEGLTRERGSKQAEAPRPQPEPETFIGAGRGQKRVAFRKKPKRKSERAGTVFPVGRIHRLIKEQTNNKVRVSAAAAVYAAAAIEYLVAEVTEISGMVAKDNGKKRISPQHLQRTVKGDTELEQLFHRVIIPESGVQPYIHPALLPKPVRGKEIRQVGAQRAQQKKSS